MRLKTPNNVAPLKSPLYISAMYGKNFKFKKFTDITMLGELFAAQILASNMHFQNKN